MPELTPNTAEIVEIYRYIKAHPKEWDQRRWGRRTLCGTAYCFAGHAAVRAGAQPVWGLRWGRTSEFTMVDTPAGDRMFTEVFAADVLHLPLHDAWELFAPNNSLDDIRRVAIELTGVDPETGEPVAAPSSLPGGEAR